MTLTNRFRYITLLLLSVSACHQRPTDHAETKDTLTLAGTYAYDANFLRKNSRSVTELKNNNAKVLLSGDYQGRVMTSTATGDTGTSFGWINYELIASGEKKQQFNPVGGEERFWLGPEGGQYALYFKKGDPFTIDHWQVPYCIDTVTYTLERNTDTQAVFSSQATLTNYSGTVFNINIERTINLLDKESIGKRLNTGIPETVNVVAYETVNRIQNTGADDWKKEKGLLSIWLLGMMTPSAQTVVIIPFVPGATSRQYISDNYFGPIPSERLVIQDSVLYFTCDGKYRSKIGLAPGIAKSRAASYDFKKNVLTLILFPVEATGMYVNSKWALQDQPYQGDVVNSYNDGPLQDGSQLGPFYELESSSSAVELKKGETQEYKQMTCHFQGDYESMRKLTTDLLHVDIHSLRR